MIGGNKPRGYTIVEVLIFLAISSLMFLMAASFISGKQSAVEFKQGTNDINAQIRSVVNDVANGQYPPASSFKCSQPLNAALPPTISPAGPAAQGTNLGCIFLGKVMQFNVGNDGTAYNIYTVAARQTGPSGAAVTTFLDARPIAVDAGLVNLTQKSVLQNGLVIKKVLQCKLDCSGANGSPIYSFGFFGSLGNYGLSQSASPESGAQTIVTASIPGGTFTDNETAAVNNINANAKNIGSANIAGNGTYILLCFQNGNKKGSVSVGGIGGQQFTTTLEAGAGVAVAC